ncbi:hypothetical protein [Mesorhizobium sp. Z1-4]|uniref:hypothetical protein n=1 Tax=Mesorhizobium sp. Z1-4 TaxID=2448478 RepID=UPI001FE094BA|nr:hypothetical protein [Mesorhizobium sp. Z1-4]
MSHKEPMIRVRFAICSLIIALAAAPAMAGEVDVVDVRAVEASNRSWTFQVTLRHADEGWDHYADAWEILDDKGVVLGIRKLLHPHVDEQPFTRSLSDVVIPDNVRMVTVRGHDSVHGYGGAEMQVVLPGR